MKRHLLWLLICSNLFFLPVYSQQRVEKMEELIKKIKQESGDLYPITVAISQLAANFPQAHALFPDLFRSAKTLRVKRHLLTEMKKYSMAGLDQALAAALEEPDARLRADAAACLENIRKSSLFSSLLEKAIRDQDAEVRLLAAGVLASTAELLVAWPALAWEIMADRNVLVRQSFLSRLVPDERVVRLLGAQLYLCLLSEDTMTAMAAARAAVRLNLFRKDSTAREKQWPVVLKAFLKALGEEDVTKAGKAAWCLDVFWNEEVAEKLKQTVTSGSFWQRARASTLLRKKKVPFDLTGLAEVLRDGSEAMQLYVCGELARLQTQECVPLVAWAMDSCFSSVRQAAVYALEVMNSVAATETLMKGLSSSDRNVRLRVARVLGRRPNSEAAFSLLKKVSESDADPEVRQAALTASLIISGADLSGVLVGRESLLQQVAELPAKKVMKTAGRMTEVKNGVVVVGSQKQLLVDDLVIEDIGSARRVLHKFKKDPRNPVLEQEFPWELQGTCCFLTTVHYDPESRLFSFWYTSFGRLAREGEAVRSRAQCLAYSTDGLHWVRPNIGLYEFQGSKKNNLVGSAANIVLIPGEKNQVEKFASYIYSPSLNAMAVSFSPDGISNWTQFQRVCRGGNDVVTVCRDDLAGGYFSFMKWRVGRHIRRSAWPAWGEKPEQMKRGLINLVAGFADDAGSAKRIAVAYPGLDFIEPPRFHTEIYQVTPFIYEGVYFGLPVRFDVSGPGAGNVDGPTDICLFYCRDRNGAGGWLRPGNETLVPTGQAEMDELERLVPALHSVLDHGRWGEWDATMHYTPSSLLVVDDEIVLYYTGASFGHEPEGSKSDGAGKNVYRVAVGRATMRLDGMVSLRAGEKETAVLTRPMLFTGHHLVVNAACKEGSLAVELTDEQGQPLPGFTRAEASVFRGDELRHVVSWKGKSDLAGLAGRVVRLRFFLRRGDLYSFQFR